MVVVWYTYRKQYLTLHTVQKTEWQKTSKQILKTRPAHQFVAKVFSLSRQQRCWWNMKPFQCLGNTLLHLCHAQSFLHYHTIPQPPKNRYSITHHWSAKWQEDACIRLCFLAIQLKRPSPFSFSSWQAEGFVHNNTRTSRRPPQQRLRRQLHLWAQTKSFLMLRQLTRTNVW